MKKLFTIMLMGISVSYSQQTITLKPGALDGKDTWSHSAPANQSLNYATEDNLIIGTWTFSGSVGTLRTMIDFDWSQIPANATVTNAVLKLYAYESVNGDTQFHSPLSGANNARIERITSSWNESTLNYLNKPTTTTTNNVPMPASTSTTQDYTMDVTALVNDMYTANQKYGFCIRLETEVQYRRLSFCSSDHPNAAKHPELIVTYTTTNSLSELSTESFRVYPNPAKNQLSVQSDFNVQDKNYTITDMSGRMLLVGDLKSNMIDLSSLESACYIIQIDGKSVLFAKE